MTPKTDGWTLVVRGFWNRMIFSPEWLQARGLAQKGQPVGIEIPVNLAGPPRLRFGGLVLLVDAKKLQVGVESIADERLQAMEALVVTVLNELPHTPVAALGVNFQWTEAEPSAALLRCFDIPDAGRLAEAGLTIKGRSIARRIEENGRTLNLSLHLGDDGVVLFDFNFHFDASDAQAAREAVTGKVLQLRDRAAAVLQTVYELG